MKEFFLILFFSKTVLLTPDPITIFGEFEISPDKPLSAITEGAGIEIDLREFAPEAGINKLGIVESRNYLESRVPLQKVRATLITEDGNLITLDQGSFALDNDQAWLTITSSAGVPTGIDFVSVLVQTGIEMREVKVYWKNSRE